jgi:hypothetical protein
MKQFLQSLTPSPRNIGQMPHSFSRRRARNRLSKKREYEDEEKNLHNNACKLDMSLEQRERESTSRAPRAGFNWVDGRGLVVEGREDTGCTSGAGFNTVGGSVLVLDSLSNEERHF